MEKEKRATAEPNAFQGSGVEFAELAPKLSQGEMEELNRLFRPFIFRIARNKEYWTSCCQRHVIINEERTVTPDMRQLMVEPHTPEPEFHWGINRRPESEMRVKCPHCGAKATLKELGRTGKRKNLWGWRRAVVFRWTEGTLWAVGVYACKSYTSPDGPMRGKERLTKMPNIHVTSINRFQPGLAEEIERGWWDDNLSWPRGVSWQTEPKKKGKPCVLGSPFRYCQDYGTGYDVVGWEEICKSPFRYVNAQEIYRKTGVRPLRIMTAACFFSEALEMLNKFGMDNQIKDYIDRGIKTNWLLNWQADKPKDFLKLPLWIVRENAGCTENMEALRIWAANKRRDDMDSCRWLAREIRDYKRRERVRKLAKDWGQRLERVVNYLNTHHLKSLSLETTSQIWLDYLDAAEHLGLDMENDVIRFPKQLQKAHDERTAQWADIQRRERETLAKKENARRKSAYAKRYKSLCLRYACSYAGLTVLVPINADEIVAEGRALKHCVGGYAGRHLEGKTTILFLRREEHPGVPLVTIEISGATIRQAHGFRNEAESCPENQDKMPVTTLYKEFFDTWLDWVKRGSPRDKDGKPKIKDVDGKMPGQQKERKVN